MRRLTGWVLLGILACGGDGGSVPSTTQPSATSPASGVSTPDTSTPVDDFNACRTFREHFVESEWGLLDSDTAAESAVGSRQVSEVAVASQDASEPSATAGEKFLSADVQDVSQGIDDMLVACASVATP